MRFFALGTDYDGTLATHGEVDAATITACEKLVASGRKLLMVTGREIDDLKTVFSRFDLFETIVAENGALLYRPATREEKKLAEPPPMRFVEELRRRGVERVSVGRVIVATWEPHETTVLEVIRDMGLELQVIFNKGAVMILPSGVNKASGLIAALNELGLSPHNAVGVGDAENDHAFLRVCECAVAVSNALPALKKEADIVTTRDHGAGVTELIHRLLDNDLSDALPSLMRHDVPLGTGRDGAELKIPPYGSSLMIAGRSGGGKTTASVALMERMAERGYQLCLVDPEGDHEGEIPGMVSIGEASRVPSVDEVMRVLADPSRSVSVNLLGVSHADRPRFFSTLLAQLTALRGRTGRPHWIVVDEAHHVLPATFDPATLTLPQRMSEMLFVTLHPSHVSPSVLAAVDTLIAVGEGAEETVGELAKAIDVAPPQTSSPKRGEALVWSPRKNGHADVVTLARAHAQHLRHQRKYAQGELGPDYSFYFKGPEGKLNLRAQNLFTFLQMADGVDDATWVHHLKRGDYSAWFRDHIKDPELATLASTVEKSDLSVAESKARIRAAIEDRYTLPA